MSPELIALELLAGVLSGMRRSRTTPNQATAFITKGPAESRSRAGDTRSALESPFFYEGRCNHGSMEELSSQALAQNERQPFRKSISHSMCLEKGVERALGKGGAPHPDSLFDSEGSALETCSHSRRGDGQKAEPRMIHTPSLSLQCRTEGGVEGHEVETLHLDNMW